MKVSIITVCRNAAVTLPDTLLAVRTQDYNDVEHLVIDGASTDATRDILNLPENSAVRWLSEPDQGIYDAMNKGLALATGEVIGFLNADDFYADTGVLTRVAAVFADPGVAAVYGDLVYVDREHPERVVRYWRSSPYRPGLFQRGWAPPHPTFFVRMSVYETCGNFDLSYPIGNDVELMLRFLARYRVNSVHLPEVLVKMRMGGVSNRSLSSILQQNRAILSALNNNGLGANPARFFLGKFLNRFWQYLARP